MKVSSTLWVVKFIKLLKQEELNENYQNKVVLFYCQGMNETKRVIKRLNLGCFIKQRTTTEYFKKYRRMGGEKIVFSVLKNLVSYKL